jgi:penicillin amidase
VGALPEIRLDEHGVPHVRADSPEGLYRGMGRCHALDRGLQMLLMRILGRGEASLHLEGSDRMLEVDFFFRRMNWRRAAPERFPEDVARLVGAYCEGANSVFAERVPWELRLLGYRPDPWTAEDVLLLSRMAGYVTLAQSQAEMERLLVEMVQAGVARGKLEELFPGRLGGLDEGLLRDVRLQERIVPSRELWELGAPRLMASNNWVIAGSRTASGKPILCDDPHLEVNRLPNVWYEVVLERGAWYAVGATMPGLPALVIGRTPALAWGVTYSFMDAVDSWIERCRGGRHERGGEWRPFRGRREVVRRKGAATVERVFHENDHGVLDGDPREDGLRLATRWSCEASGVASTCAFAAILEAGNVPAGREALGRVESAWNWVLADRDGNIGYQMSGLAPLRREGISGLVPLPGWDPENDWRGFAAPEDLPRCLNPERGYFVTANQDLNEWGKVAPINLPMGPSRAGRIARLLSEGKGFRVEDMGRIHYDVVSPHAETYLRALRPLLPDTPQGRLLRGWDGGYGTDSKGAFLFERFYRELLVEAFGRGGLGAGAVRHLLDESGVFIDFYADFDRVLLSERSAWFGERDPLFRRVAASALDVEPRPWGESQEVVLSHVLLGGKLPRFLGFDRGPIALAGGRGTVCQGQVYRSGGRVTSFAPSYRFVTDLAADEVRTNLCGGPSDRRFSGRYVSDLEGWRAKRYKRLGPGPTVS